jgi:hypothetical protein
MDKAQFSEYLAKLGRKGGKARQEQMTDKERLALVRKASKAAAKARQKKARERKKAQAAKKARTKTEIQWLIPKE